MRLFHKILLCFVVVFSITFHAAGYLLINYSYENVMEQQKKIAYQDYLHNRDILQSILYTDEEFFIKNIKNYGLVYENVLKNFTVPINLYSTFSDNSVDVIGIDRDLLTMEYSTGSFVTDWKSLYICEKEQGRTIFECRFFEGNEEKVAFHVLNKNGKSYIFMFGSVRLENAHIFLLTQTDITAAISAQKNMAAYFQRVYILILCISFPVIFLLTRALTSPIRKVGEAAERIAGGNYSQRIHVKGKDEIGELAGSFNHMAQQVEDKIVQLSDMVRQKEDFTANFAHELKTPMTSVIGYADMLYQRKLPREDVKRAAGYILDEGMRLESLSLKLMDLFVLDRQDFLLEELSAPEMFKNIRPGIEPLCKKYGVILHMAMEEGIIRVDFDLFKTLILNLADNAVKAGGKDLWLSGKAEGNSYRIEIRDNGRGIPEEEQGRITEAFYMVDKSRSRKQHGAGLGMTLAAKIAENHGAKMEIDSDGKTGTTICLAFALVKGGGNEENIYKEAP